MMIQVHIKRGPGARDSFKGLVTGQTSTHWRVTSVIATKPVLHRIEEWIPKNSEFVHCIVYAQ